MPSPPPDFRLLFESVPELWPTFAARGVRKYPRLGDISARSALTFHGGTAHASPVARPVLVLGVDAPGAGHAALSSRNP